MCSVEISGNKTYFTFLTKYDLHVHTLLHRMRLITIIMISISREDTPPITTPSAVYEKKKLTCSKEIHKHTLRDTCS